MSQEYCYSCGQPIPDGQGHSCSMCYGDPYYGRDGYYLDWLQDAYRQEDAKRAQEEYEYEQLWEEKRRKEMSGTRMAIDLLSTIYEIRDIAIDGDAGDGIVPDADNMRDALHAILDLCNAVVESVEIVEEVEKDG